MTFLKLFLFIYDQPWNRELKEENNLIRVNNWSAIHQKIKDLKK